MERRSKQGGGSMKEATTGEQLQGIPVRDAKHPLY